MNTEKILELLGTTPKQKMETLHRQESGVIVSAEESANDLLNAELFGTKRKAAKEGVAARKPLPEELKQKLRARMEETESTPVTEHDETEETVSDAGMICHDAVAEDGSVAIYLDYDPSVADKGLVDSLMQQITDAGLTLENAVIDDETADEAVATEGCRGLKRRCSKECDAQTVVNEDAGVAEEAVVKTTSEKFPDDFTFDEAAFAEEYGISQETISCVYVPEDPQAKITEHIEVSFQFEESTVTLSILADGTVNETVDAEVVEPAQFSSGFVEQEQEDGTTIQVLVLNLIDEEESGAGAVKSEEDSLTKSEGDEKHIDEDGNGSTDEFVEEAGLDIDGFYADTHGMPKAKKSVHEVKSVAREEAGGKWKKSKYDNEKVDMLVAYLEQDGYKVKYTEKDTNHIFTISKDGATGTTTFADVDLKSKTLRVLFETVKGAVKASGANESLAAKIIRTGKK